MIELIFAIVIIGIAVVSLPVMMQVAAGGVKNTLVQEAIFAASAELNQATSYYWDENSIQDVNLSSLSRVINTTGDCNITTNKRPGHISRRCLQDNNESATNASDANTNDIDDAFHTPQSIFISATSIVSDTGYKHDYQSEVVVANDSFDTATASNIKKITIIITDGDNGNTVTSLSAYSANVGEVDFHKRTY